MFIKNDEILLKIINAGCILHIWNLFKVNEIYECTIYNEYCIHTQIYISYTEFCYLMQFPVLMCLSLDRITL